MKTIEAGQKKTKVDTIKGTKTWYEWVNFKGRSKREGDDKQSYIILFLTFYLDLVFSLRHQQEQMLYLLSISG